MRLAIAVLLGVLTIALASLALAKEDRGVWIEDTPCAEEEVLVPTYYQEWSNGSGADAAYVCRNAEDFAISLIREVEGSHDSVTCLVVARRQRHWYRQHGLQVVATEMCHH